MRIARLLPRATTPASCGRSRRSPVGVGALFLRAFERGERVYLAMVSRGYDRARMPAGRIDGAGAAAAAVGLAARRGARRRPRLHRGR